MPAYGKNLSPSEITALVDFLDTLHPPGQPGAVDASRAAANTPSSEIESVDSAKTGGVSSTQNPHVASGK
jgi:hypothetical protein